MFCLGVPYSLKEKQLVNNEILDYLLFSFWGELDSKPYILICLSQIIWLMQIGLLLIFITLFCLQRTYVKLSTYEENSFPYITAHMEPQT